MKRLRIMWWKFRARRAYLRYLSMREQYDCGSALAEHINPAIAVQLGKVERYIALIKREEA